MSHSFPRVPIRPVSFFGMALVLLLLAVAPAYAQPLIDADEERHPLRHFVLAKTEATQSRASLAFDATYYHLQVDFDFAQKRISGTTHAVGSFTQPEAQLHLDLLSNMHVTAVRSAAGEALSFSHANDLLTIDLGRTVVTGEVVAVEIDYEGQPQAPGFGAFVFTSTDGQPVAWTLSEPYGARAWWPGKDHPSDKADSARVTVTVPEGLRVGSNGRLASVATEAGTVTYDWVTQYPIAPYLLSLAVGPYAAFEQVYRRPDSLAATLGPLALPILHYKYTSGGTATLPEGWAEVVDALAVFEWWFGPYPFAEEKYGHAEFDWGGGMEHQTMTSMGGTNIGLMTHELAHQWFGDAVTTRTWPHLWLNEGFASYAEVLYWEAQADRYPGSARAVLQFDQSSARSAQGTLVVQDTLSISNLFAGSRVYSKGSAVLHMLRYVLGDTAFRATLQGYLTDPALTYGTAVTDDLQRVAEDVSGQSLEAFFRQWVTEGTGYPVYAVSYSVHPAEGGHDVYVHVSQTQTPPTSNVAVFEMPLTLAVQTAVGEQRFVVHNTQRDQTFLLAVEAEPTDLVFDPDGVLLRNDGVDVILDVAPGQPVIDFALTSFPNPATDRLRLDVAVPAAGPLTVHLVDVLGRRVRVLWDSTAPVGPFRIDADVRGLPAGVYLVQARTETRVYSAPVLVVH